MTATVDNSSKAAEALLKEARAVKRTAKAYGALNRSSPVASVSRRDVSREIVIAFLGGGKV